MSDLENAQIILPNPMAYPLAYDAAQQPQASVQQHQNGSYPIMLHPQNGAQQPPYQTYVMVQPTPMSGSPVHGRTGYSFIAADPLSLSPRNAPPPSYYGAGRALVVGSGFGPTGATTETQLSLTRAQRRPLAQQGAHMNNVDTSVSDWSVTQVSGLFRFLGLDAAAGLVCQSVSWVPAIFSSVCGVFWSLSDFATTSAPLLRSRFCPLTPSPLARLASTRTAEVEANTVDGKTFLDLTDEDLQQHLHLRPLQIRSGTCNPSLVLDKVCVCTRVGGWMCACKRASVRACVRVCMCVRDLLYCIIPLLIPPLIFGRRLRKEMEATISNLPGRYFV